MRLLSSVGVLAALIWCALGDVADENFRKYDSSESSGTEYVVRLMRKQSARSVELVSTRADKFSAKFFKKMYESDRGSKIFSPLSFFLPLSMLSYGAQGAARGRFFSAIGISNNESHYAKEGYRRLVDKLSRFNVRVRTKIYYASTQSPPPVFYNLAMKVFKTEMESSTTDVSPQRINDWIRWNTDNRGENSIDAPFEFTSRPSISLATVFYFKGSWESRFDRSLTSRRPFFKDPSTVVVLPTMYKYGQMLYGRIEAIGVDFVELPFKSTRPGEAMSVFLIRPRDRSFHLDPIIDRIQENRFADLRKVHKRRVHLWLPKFKYELVEDFGARLRHMFTELENPLRGAWRNATIRPPRPMSVSRGFVKYFIEIDEDGGALPPSVESCETEDLVHFDVNHPFVAVIAVKGRILLDVITLKIYASTLAGFVSATSLDS